MTPPANAGAVTSDGRVLVLRGCCTWRPGFPFPPVGERFEAPGADLVPIATGPRGENVPDDQHGVGIHCWAWGVTSGEQGAANYFGVADRWLVLDVDPADLAYDHGRTSGRCRVKRGVVAYTGTLEGATGLLRERWPKDAGPPPPWEDDPIMFPPRPTWLGRQHPPPPPGEVFWGRNHQGHRYPAW